MVVDGYLIKRKLLGEVREHLEQKEISLVVGPRQVGKTTLMLLLENELRQQGHETIYLNLDREADRRHFASQEALINKIRLELGQQKGFVFIDGIQIRASYPRLPRRLFAATQVTVKDRVKGMVGKYMCGTFKVCLYGKRSCL